MRRLKVLLEGASDVPAVREVLVRRFGLVEDVDFELFPHRGKGRLPSDLLSPPLPERRGLLDQLPAKLKGFSYLGSDHCVVVVVDADDEDCSDLLQRLIEMLDRLPRRPQRVLFRLAVEETESWFIADAAAVQSAYPKARLSRLRRLTPDAVVGAWEQLAAALEVDLETVSGMTKHEWAAAISPHLDLTTPCSPSLRKFVDGVARELCAT